jgi:DNA polymerase elongation subunit (family B)
LYNPNEANAYIQKLPTAQAIEEIKKSIITLAGTLFAKHSEKIGLFADFLLRMQNMRNEYRAKLKEYPKDSIEYEFNNNRQKSVKVVMNTTYGLYGLSSFRYSNHWLARSITNNGIFTNKVAQWIAEDHLKFRYGGKS